MDRFIPTGLDLAGWGGVLFAALVLTGLGRLVSGGRAAPETALVAGWGGAALVLTLWGVTTPASLRIPGAGIAAAGLAGLLAPRLRLLRAEWRSVARIAVLALPLIAVMASARPSEPDTFLNLLPNDAYLYDHAAFPADDRPPAHSYLPAAPYNLQLAAFIAGLVTPGFPPNALIVLNLVLQLAAALLLARLVTGAEDAPDAVPSWGASALGILLVTALNPGFVPRYHLSGYDEPAVAVTVAFAGWLAAQALARLRAGGGAGAPLLLLALTLAALVNIKQDAVVLAAAVPLTAALLALATSAPRRALPLLALASLPAALLYLAWRFYVLSHVSAGELAPLPRAMWQLDAVPLILWHMLEIIGQKIFFYAVLAATLAATAWRWRRRGLDPPALPAALLGGGFVIYSAALVAAYVALFPGTMGSDAHSYFRYSTHLALLLMVAIVALVRAEARERAFALAGRWRLVPGALVIASLACPLLLSHLLRFDLEPTALRVWLLAGEAAPHLGDRDRVALLLPGDNGSVAAMLETVLRVAPPRRPDLDLTVASDAAPDTLARLAAQGYRLALLSCAPAGFAAAPPGSAALLARDDGAWHAAAVWPYPPPPPGARWSHVLADAPLCLRRE